MSELGAGRRIAIRGGVVAAVVIAVTLWLVARAVDGVRQQERARHQAVAEDLFDELERELSVLVDTEERRSFLEYRHLYVPEGVPIKGTAGLVRSPLADLPTDPAILGYFQLDPGGACTNPAVPRDNEVDAARAAGWQPTEAVAGRQARIDAALAAVGPLPSAHTPLPRPPPAAEDGTVGLRRGANARQLRESQVVQAGKLNLEAYHSAEDVLQNVLDANALEVGIPFAVPVEPASDVWISPIRGLPAGSSRGRETGEAGGFPAAHGNTLVLYREVRAAGETHQQGLVLDLDALGRRLEGAVLGGSELAPYVTLRWDPAPVSSSRGFAFSHRFAAPFESWWVGAEIAPVPELRSSEPWVLGGLAGLVLVVVLGGGASIRWLVDAELELARRRSDFAAAVTHELKTPLTAIRMYGEMLRDGMVGDPERQREYHGTLVSEAERLSRLVDDVLELSRLQRAGLRPTGAPAEQVELGPLLAHVAELTRALVDRAGARVEVWTAPSLPSVRIDRDGLVQVLSNLVDNAVKFSAEAADRRVHLRAAVDGDRVAVSVRDHGPGVPPSQLRAIFDPFFRGEHELTRRTKGTGLGLALVEGLVTRAGGVVSARNHPEGGLEVTLHLRAAD